ncbi:MAG: cytochrome c [Syntrophobacterales bacterium]|nr:cytochrome c [Syntrophobacterales bacterium]
MRRSLVGTVAAALVLAATSGWPQDLPGEELAARLGCRACHAWQGVGGARAPALDGVGRRKSRPDLERQLTSTPSRRMPSFAYLRPQDWQALLTFLEGL